jgi:hypothetical protein
MKSSVFWDVMQFSLLKFNQHFGGTCHLHLQGQRVCQARNHTEAGNKQGYSVEYGNRRKLACSVTNHVSNVKYTTWRTYPGPMNQAMIRAVISNVIIS